VRTNSATVGAVLGLGLALSACSGFEPDRAPRPASVPSGWQVVERGKCSAALPGDWTVVSGGSSESPDVYGAPDDSGQFYQEQFTEMDKPPAEEELPEFVSARNPSGEVRETSRRAIQVTGSDVAYLISGNDDAGEVTVVHAWGGQTGAWLVLNGPQATYERIVSSYTCAL
jgi:hypothetical protein